MESSSKSFYLEAVAGILDSIKEAMLVNSCISMERRN